MSESSLRYTLFTEEHIIDFVNNTFGITLDKQNMIKPDRALMMDVLPNFVKTFNIDTSQFDLEACQGTCSVNNMETFIRLSNLTRAVQGILNYTNFNDFNVGDVIFPKRKRNQKIFSQLIALMLNYLELDQKWRDNEEKLEHLPAQRSTAMERCNLMREKIEETSIELSRLKHRNQPLRAEYKDLMAQIKGLEAEQPKLNEQRTRMKAEISEINSKISELMLQIDNVKGAIELQRMKIVSSPDKLFANAEGKKNDLKKACTTLNGVKRESIEMRNWLAELDKQLEGLNVFGQLRDELGTLTDAGLELTTQIHESVKERKLLVDRTEELLLSLHSLEKNKKALEKDQQQLENNHKMEMRPFVFENNRFKNALETNLKELNKSKTGKVNFQPLDEKRCRQKEMIESIQRLCNQSKQEAQKKMAEMLKVIKNW